MIDEELKQRIKEANEIVDVIGQFVSLRKKALIIWGYVPFIRINTLLWSSVPQGKLINVLSAAKVEMSSVCSGS